MWNVESFNVSIRFTEPLLGTVALQEGIYEKHIADKQLKALKKSGQSEELAKLELEQTAEDIAQELTVGLTGFYADDNGHYLRDYQIKGYLKNAASQLKVFGKTKQLRSKVVNFVFVKPKKIYLATGQLEVCERPIRCETPMGPRTAIARSLMIPAGKEVSFTVDLLQGVIGKDCLETLLAYGQYAGVGAWRGAGHGSFEVLSIEELA